jgi:hypothetical protein
VIYLKLEYQTIRRIAGYISLVSDNILQKHHLYYDLDDKITAQDIIKKLNDNIDWDRKQFENIWKLAETGRLFDNWFVSYKIKKKRISLKQIKKILKDHYGTLNSSIVLELYNKPRIFLISKLDKTRSRNIEKSSVAEYNRDVIYWVPEKGILLTDIHDDDNGNSFLDKMKELLIGELESYRYRVMALKDFYNDFMELTKITVNADSQITGFDGLYQIEFKGDHVKKGLYGLNKRHDIRVNLDGIGPRIEICSHNLQLKIGNSVKVTSFDGINELYKVLNEY